MNRFLLILIIAAQFFASSAPAVTFKVNSGFDVNDLTPGNGLCVAYLFINPPFVLPFCTLRAAVEEANSLPGEDTIILGSGTYTYALSGTDENLARIGDLDITDSVEIIGAGPDKTFINANRLDRVFDIIGEDTFVTLSKLSIINGIPPAGQGGAGIRSQGTLLLYRSTVAGNTVLGSSEKDSGGGLLNSGTCLLSTSTVSNNQAAQGGGIMNSPGGSLRLTASTVMTNSSEAGAGLFNDGSASLINSTFSANRAVGYLSSGGAIYNNDQLELVHCTIADNVAGEGAGLKNETGTLSILNTILANNTGGNCAAFDHITSRGYNLTSDDSCDLTDLDLVNTDPRLARLQENWGQTMTHGLKPGSPAIDAGMTLTDITTDQRAVKRPQRKFYDIGAFEAEKTSIVPLFTPLIL